jgi:hypothetical protein
MVSQKQEREVRLLLTWRHPHSLKEVMEMEERKEASASIWVWVVVIVIAVALVVGFVMFLRP